MPAYREFVGRIRAWYAVAFVVFAAGYFALPVVRQAFVAGLGLLVIGTIEFGVRRLRPDRPGGWRRLEIALLLLGVGSIVFGLREAALSGPVPYPSPADIFYTASYLPIAGGLYRLGRPHAPYRDETSLIDAISLTLAGSLVAWVLVLRASLDSPELSPAGRVAAVAGWVGFVAVLTGSVRLLLAWRRNAAATLLVVAVLCYLASGLFRRAVLFEGTYRSGTVIDAGYIAFAGLCGAAALMPSMRDVAAPAHTRHTLGPVRLALLAAGLLVAPTVLLVEWFQGQVMAGPAIAIIGALVSLLILMRTSMTGTAYRRRAAREQAARVASQAMVSATTTQDVVAGTRAALRAVLDKPGQGDVELARAQEVDEGSAQDGRWVVPVAGTRAALVFTGPAGELVDLADLLHSLADQAAVALQRMDLAEAAKAEERERYFRSLVQTSTDVIVISREGRIEYATPSAARLFGRDVHGEDIGELVQPAETPWTEPVDGAEAAIAGPKGEITVMVHQRDLTQDPSVRGVVTTMRDVTAERRLQRDLAYRASHDELTGLINARAWGETLARKEDRRRELGGGIAAIFIDLDNFKQVNDRHGHAAGDRVLAETGRRVRECVRPGDLAARVGGDEFAVLLLGLGTVSDARATAEGIVRSLSRPVPADPAPIDCPASAGLAYTEGGETLHDLLRDADTALYAAKAQGKGRWAEYHPGLAGTTVGETDHSGAFSVVDADR